MQNWHFPNPPGNMDSGLNGGDCSLNSHLYIQDHSASSELFNRYCSRQARQNVPVVSQGKNAALSLHGGPLLGVNGHLIKLSLSLQLVYSEQRG